MQEKNICSRVLFWLPFIVEGGKYEKLHALKDYALRIFQKV